MINNVLVLTGPTASGKSSLAQKVALALSGEIICMDSMQVYVGLDIGTAKPSAKEQKEVPHHLFDIREPGQPFSVAEYFELAQKTVEDIHKRGRLPIFVGGTGLYLRALQGGLDFGGTPSNPIIRERYQKISQEEGNLAVHRILAEKDPQSAARLHPNNLRRVIRALEILETTGQPMGEITKVKPLIPYALKAYALFWPREQLYERINLRVDEMMATGLLDEVKALLQKGLPQDAQCMQSLGYKELIPYLLGKGTLIEAVEVLKRRTRNYAKRQLTWFMAEKDLTWLPGETAIHENADTIVMEMRKV